MSEEIDGFKINNFSLSSSSEVFSVVREVEKLIKSSNVIHISSYIHNTVLVQTLKKELSRLPSDIYITLMKHDDKVNTSLTMFSSNSVCDETATIDVVLNEMYLEYINKDEIANKCRTQLFGKFFTDQLTSLPNVYQLRKDMQVDDEYGLVLIKIDNFATINNFYGFVIGDYVIEEISKYLSKTITEYKIYRLSGAEFGFILDKKMSFYELKLYLNELYKKINSFFVMHQKSKIFVDFTMASSSSIDNEKIFSKVSMALNYAKQIGVPFWIYEDRMNFENDYERNIELSEIVREAVKESRIVPYFQAIIDNKTSKIVKYECLARLIDKDEKVLSPVLFIPIAKKIKIYNEITKQMIDKSFEAFKDSDMEFNINLSIEDIMSSEIFNFILEKVKNFKAASRVTFELLESESVEDFQRVERFITELKRYGAKVAIDDFGSGYSNFSYLIQIKAQYIKIDGSLIKDIDVDKSALLVVETIVSFAKKLGIKTVAEFVHSSVVMDKVKELGIDYSQGFYIDKPSINNSKRELDYIIS
ncbi:EAL domain-containing protein [Sulfurimonas aquatica]|uniref:EAL domain-containing protein n=1 Tax=Sulfurimonas aquatica TaxID=2672570 RepID=A0A975B0E3_9BACT|nr:GGDEF domain-containing phosphodiesterase [Sulfurimonas aquatica]QSZ41894.1 EAL domain-containing protein [Sulfurimonas aquatica]